LRSGELYQVNLDATVGEEIQRSRPVVVLNPGHANNLRLAIVVPVTAWRQGWDKNPFFLTITPRPRHGLRKKSAVDCFQIRAISHGRFIKKLGTLSSEEVEQIRKALALILDIEPEHCQL
jgi:mRNA interferase MazF